MYGLAEVLPAKKPDGMWINIMNSMVILVIVSYKFFLLQNRNCFVADLDRSRGDGVCSNFRLIFAALDSTHNSKYNLCW